MDMQKSWLRGLRAWASRNGNVRELWLFGSSADGTSSHDSDVDIGVGLMPPTSKHNWALGNYSDPDVYRKWRTELEAIVGGHFSLANITPELGTGLVVEPGMISCEGHCSTVSSQG